MEFSLRKAGHRAEQVFHRARHAHHHMCFYLGNVNDKICVQHGLHQLKRVHTLALCFAHTRFAAKVKRRAGFFAHGCHAALRINGAHAAGRPCAAGRICHRDVLRQNPTLHTGADACCHHRRVRGNGPFRRMFCQQVRLQQHTAVRPKPPSVWAKGKHGLHGRIHLRLFIACARFAQHAFGRGLYGESHQTPSPSKKRLMRCSASVRCAME